MEVLRQELAAKNAKLAEAERLIAELSGTVLCAHTGRVLFTLCARSPHSVITGWRKWNEAKRLIATRSLCTYRARAERTN